MIKRFVFHAGLPIGQSLEDSAMQLIGDAIPAQKSDFPKFVVLPAALGGGEIGVAETIGFQPCVHRNCKHRHPTMMLQKVYPDGRQLAVMECKRNGFLWHKREVEQ